MGGPRLRTPKARELAKKIASKTYRDKHKADHAVYMHKYYLENKERLQANMMAWRTEHPDWFKAINKRYRESPAGRARVKGSSRNETQTPFVWLTNENGDTPTICATTLMEKVSYQETS